MIWLLKPNLEQEQRSGNQERASLLHAWRDIASESADTHLLEEPKNYTEAHRSEDGDEDDGSMALEFLEAMS